MSIDHRFVDGVLAARLLKGITYYFDRPDILNDSHYADT